MKRSRLFRREDNWDLKKHEAGVSVADLCRKHGVHGVSTKFGGWRLRGQTAEDAGG